MKVALPSEVEAAVLRLRSSSDYELLRKWLGNEFDREMMGVIHSKADAEAYVRIGRAQMFHYVLMVMQGGDSGKT